MCIDASQLFRPIEKSGQDKGPNILLETMETMEAMEVFKAKVECSWLTNKMTQSKPF